MKVAVLGATGQTGVELVKLALQAGHEVTAVVRNPDKLKMTNEKLKVVIGDIFAATSLEPHFQGADVIVSCLGFPRDKVVTGYTESMKSIGEAMRKQNVKRLVTMTAFFTDMEAAKNEGFLVNWILIPMLKPILKNMREMELLLEADYKDLSWTVVRPPGLGSGPVTDTPVKIEEGVFFTHGHSPRRRMNRADVAKVMLDIASSDNYQNKCVAVNY